MERLINTLLTQVINPLPDKDLTSLVLRIANYVALAAVPICTIMVLVAAFQMLTSAGDPEKIKKSKQTLVWALVGFGIALLAVGIPYLVKEVLGVKTP